MANEIDFEGAEEVKINEGLYKHLDSQGNAQEVGLEELVARLKDKPKCFVWVDGELVSEAALVELSMKLKGKLEVEHPLEVYRITMPKGRGKAETWEERIAQEAGKILTPGGRPQSVLKHFGLTTTFFAGKPKGQIESIYRTMALYGPEDPGTAFKLKEFAGWVGGHPHLFRPYREGRDAVARKLWVIEAVTRALKEESNGG